MKCSAMLGDSRTKPITRKTSGATSPARIEIQTTAAVVEDLRALTETGLYGATIASTAEELLRLKLRELLAQEDRVSPRTR